MVLKFNIKFLSFDKKMKTKLNYCLFNDNFNNLKILKGSPWSSGQRLGSATGRSAVRIPHLDISFGEGEIKKFAKNTFTPAIPCGIKIDRA